MFEEISFDTLLKRMLDRVPDTVDKREGSIIYDALAPAAVELQLAYLSLSRVLNQAFFDTADREGKLKRCRERGIDVSIFDATPAVCLMRTEPADVPITDGERFNYESLNFEVIGRKEDGLYQVRCETPGTAGNVTGTVFPINYIRGLKTAEIAAIQDYGADEADESLIETTYYASLNAQAYGGNRADYYNKVHQIAGVGGVKLYSASEWKGGGTVKVVITTSSYTVPSEDFIHEIQTMLDPEVNAGDGYGIAPVGHTVTVAAAGETYIHTGFRLTLQDGFAVADVRPYIEEAIDEYIKSLNRQWETVDNIIVRVSQIETRILDIPGVLDIGGTRINGVEANCLIAGESIVKRGETDVSTG